MGLEEIYANVSVIYADLQTTLNKLVFHLVLPVQISYEQSLFKTSARTWRRLYKGLQIEDKHDEQAWVVYPPSPDLQIKISAHQPVLWRNLISVHLATKSEWFWSNENY
jgi:hypothetical protein